MTGHDPFISKCRNARILKFLIKHKVATIHEILDYIKNVTIWHLIVVMRSLVKRGLVIEVQRKQGKRGYSWYSKGQYMAADNDKVKELIQILE